MNFPEKLQKLRKERGWSQEELANRITVSRQAVQNGSSVLPFRTRTTSFS